MWLGQIILHAEVHTCSHKKGLHQKDTDQNSLTNEI